MSLLITLFLVLMTLGSSAHALSLGDITVKSGFAEPLRAEIDIPSASTTELESLQVSQAPLSVYEKAGIEYGKVQRRLQFKLIYRKEDNRPIIRVRTDKAVKELALSFFIDATWAGGNMTRGYDILLTPPLANANTTTLSPRQLEEGVIDTRLGLQQQKVASPKPAAGTLNYGPVRPGEILGVIARRMVPDRQYSLQQVMVGIFDQNPNAFNNGNINQLEPGTFLRIDAEESLARRSRGEAVNLINEHTRQWRGEALDTRTPDNTAFDLPSDVGGGILKIEEVSESDAELKIVSPNSIDLPRDGRIEPTEVMALRKELTVTLEEAEALKKQNEGLKAKVEELEQLVAQRMAQLMPEQAAVIGIDGKTSIIDKSEKVYQDDLVTGASDISLQEQEKSYMAEIFGLILVLIGISVIYIVFFQRSKVFDPENAMVGKTLWEQLKLRFGKKSRKVTIHI